MATALLATSARAQFVDRTAEAGLTAHGMTWGAIFADFDGDGTLDLYVGHHYSRPVLFWNDGLGVFDSTTHAPPWAGLIDRHGPLAVPLRTGVLPDLFIAHGADAGYGSEPNELYRNDGGGVLRSLLGAGGASDPEGRKRSCSAADFDGDHKVDIYTAEAPNVTDGNSLYRNNGNFTFTDVAAAAGIDEGLGTVGGIWGDFDDDGDPDLLVGGEEFQRPTVLWRNDGGVFHDASNLFEPPLPVVSGADWGDFDNDGDLDLAVVQGNIGLWDTYSEGDSLTYYFNTRYADTGLDGLTVPCAAETSWARFHYRGTLDTSLVFLGPLGVHPPLSTMVALTDDYVGAPTFNPGVDRGTYVWRDSPGGDWEIRCSTPNLNYDTFDGFMIADQPITGVTPVSLEDPHFPPGGARVWRNDGGHFTEITDALGLTLMVNPRDVSWVDYDNDGDLDLHVVDMGTSAQPNAPDRLYRNDGVGAPFVDVAAAEGVQGSSIGMGDGAVWGDVDGDGDLDLFLQEGAGPLTFNVDGRSRLFVNEGERGHSLLLDLVGFSSGVAAVGTNVDVFVGSLVVHRRVQANAWRGFEDPLTVHAGIGPAQFADSVAIRWPAGYRQVLRNLPAGHYQILEGRPSAVQPIQPRTDGETWTLGGGAPQPAGGVQRFAIDAPYELSLDVVVRDVAGRRVRTLHHGTVPAGHQQLSWDGRDEHGHRVASGVYWIRATDGRVSRTVRSVRVE